MTVPSTLGDIRTKVRRITGRPSESQLSNTELDAYINTFYLYDLPEHLRLFNLKETYTFTTEPNVDQYAFTPNTYVSVEPPAYVAGYETSYFQDYDSFFTLYPFIQTIEDLDTGTGVAGPYAGTITSTPVLANRVLVSAQDGAGNTLVAIDNGAGVFAGDVTGGTINYVTGAIAALTFTAAIPAGNDIEVQYHPYAAARPQAILFYDDTFTLRPVPDNAYQVELQGYRVPTEMTIAADEPEYNELWQLIAYGTALKIFADNLDLESYQKVDMLFDKQKCLIERRTLKQLSNQRTATIYTDNAMPRGNYPYL